jgi:hypothetical protein
MTVTAIRRAEVRGVSADPRGAAPGAWRAARSVRVLGRRIRLESNRPEALVTLLALVPPVWKAHEGPSVERVYSLRVEPARAGRTASHHLLEDGEVVTVAPGLDWALKNFEWRLKAYLAEHARQRVIVHAGAVGWKGRAIVLPGASMSGKTSLVAELLRAGASYYSDEYAVLDMRGRVHPYPTPLQIRDERTLIQTPRRARDLGGAMGVKPLPVGVIVLSQYRPGARWRPRRLSGGEAILRMVAHTVSARRSPGVVLPVLRQAVEKARAWMGTRGQARAVARWILAEASADAPPHADSPGRASEVATSREGIAASRKCRKGE